MELLNEQYNLLYMEYTKRQNDARYELEKRYNQVISVIPEISKLDEAIGELSVAAAEQSLQGDDSAFNQLNQSIEGITKKKSQLLSKAGYPEDYLTLHYICPDCRDTGYNGIQKCHCFQKMIVEYLYAGSNMQDILSYENFSNFSLDYYPDDYIEETTNLTPRDNMRGILQTVHAYLQNFDEKYENLLLYGSTGVGKTFLSHCIAKELLDTSHTVVYLTSLELFDILETNKFDRDISIRKKNISLSYIMSCDLLIIDDLGTEMNNTFVSSSLYQVIDTRLLTKHSTIISTNLSFDDLSTHYSERIFSRITSHYKLLKLTGNDIRFAKAIASPDHSYR